MATTLAGLLAHVPMTGVVVAVGAAVAVFVTTRPLQRWRAIRQLGPRLAASVGEVKPVVDYDAPTFPAASRNAYTRVP
ncbi:MAG: hypothetical protein K8W52_13860 [Deltaproteobacteria bacterium]|nr:hypothetical protein [Deltaproteobacteria bacterium]